MCARTQTCPHVLARNQVLKVIAANFNVLTYLTSPWNSLDCVIICEGWLSLFELTPGLSWIRIVRLLRLLRLAKPFPSLRSIVGALFAGVISCGWIMLLLTAFNYIMACMGVLFRDHESTQKLLCEKLKLLSKKLKNRKARERHPDSVAFLCLQKSTGKGY